MITKEDEFVIAGELKFYNKNKEPIKVHNKFGVEINDTPARYIYHLIKKMSLRNYLKIQYADGSKEHVDKILGMVLKASDWEIYKDEAIGKIKVPDGKGGFKKYKEKRQCVIRRRKISEISGEPTYDY